MRDIYTENWYVPVWAGSVDCTKSLFSINYKNEFCPEISFTFLTPQKVKPDLSPNKKLIESLN